MQAVGRNQPCLALRMLLIVLNTEILSILGSILIISKLTNLQSDVKMSLLFKLSIIVNISYISVCRNLLVVSPDFTCFATKRKHKIKGILKCGSRNIIYILSCKCCGKQYVGFATGFEERLRIHKSDINIGKMSHKYMFPQKIKNGK